MPSLFRIDRNSLTADGVKPTSVVLPGFQDLVKQNTEIQKQSQVEEESNDTVQSVIDREVLEKQNELARLQSELDALKIKADTIIENAQSEAEEIKQAAMQKGYEEGFAQAAESARQEQLIEQKRVEDAIVTLQNAKDSVFEQIEDSVMDLAMFVAEHIIKTEMDRNDEVFVNIVRDTLSKVRYQNNIIIRVSKNEYEKLFADPNSEIIEELRNSGVEVRQDLSLKEGDCIAETEFGTINSGIKTQLKRLGYALEDSSTEQN